jgi:hypothetical protein
MNLQPPFSRGANVQSPEGLSPSTSASPVLMTCEECDLVGGPFEAAEAAHLRAIHNRLHHGILVAA